MGHEVIHCPVASFLSSIVTSVWSGTNYSPSLYLLISVDVEKQDRNKSCDDLVTLQYHYTSDL